MARDDAKCTRVIPIRMHRRTYYRTLEAGCDAGLWLFGLTAAAWVTHDLASSSSGIRLAGAAIAVGVLSAGPACSLGCTVAATSGAAWTR